MPGDDLLPLRHRGKLRGFYEWKWNRALPKQSHQIRPAGMAVGLAYGVRYRSTSFATDHLRNFGKHDSWPRLTCAIDPIGLALEPLTAEQLRILEKAPEEQA